MNKTEAIAAMKAGQKVTHKYFSDSEWVTLTPTGMYQFEDGHLIPSLIFWEDRKLPIWEDGWSLFAAPPPASEGEWYPGKDYQRLFNRISETNGIALNSDMNEIIRIVHEDFPATLPTREPESIKILPKNFKIITIAEDGSAILQYSPII